LPYLKPPNCLYIMMSCCSSDKKKLFFPDFSDFSLARKVARREKWRTFHSKKINLISKMGKIVMFRGNVGIK